MYKFSQSSEEINSNGGFSFIKKLLDGNCGMPLRDSHLPAARNSRYPTASIVRSLVGIQTAGECDYADVEKFWDDFLFRELAGRQGAVRGVVQAASGQPLGIGTRFWTVFLALQNRFYSFLNFISA